MSDDTTYKLGTKVETLIEFASLPIGSVGYIVEDYGSGIWIAWDLPSKPYPKHKTPEEIRDMAALDPECPLRDGFDKKYDLDYLKIC